MKKECKCRHGLKNKIGMKRKCYKCTYHSLLVNVITDEYKIICHYPEFVIKALENYFNTKNNNGV